MRSGTLHRAAAPLLAACCLLFASCMESGVRLPETGATLEGTVSYGNEKVLVALVIVQGEKSSATGDVGEDGRYKVENVPLGEVKIAVNTDAGKGKQMSKAMAQSQGKAKALPKVIDVPPKYANPETSGLKTSIKKGSNTYDVVISK